MLKTVSSMMIAAGCALSATPSLAVSYSLQNLGISYNPALPSGRSGLPYFLTNTNDVFYQTLDGSFKESNGVVSTLAGSGTGTLRGANADGDYIIGTKLYSSKSYNYAFSGTNPTTALNDNHDLAIRLSSTQALYATLGGYTGSDTTYLADPGNTGVEIETLGKTGIGAGITTTNPAANFDIFTSRFSPSNPNERAGSAPHVGPNDGKDHDATNVVEYAPSQGGRFQSVVGVTDGGAIAGTLFARNSLGGESDQAYFGTNGVTTNIGALGGSSVDYLGRSQANDMNNAGQVVGASTFGGFRFGQAQTLIGLDYEHGFIYQDGALLDLNALLDGASAGQYTVVSALSINDGGSILVAFDSGTEATNLNFGRNLRFGLLTAVAQASVPEPASWAMMIAGFGLVGGTMRRRAVAVRLA